MVVPTGLSGQLGFGVESTYGVAGTINRFFEFNTESLDKVKNTVQGGGLAGGRLGRLMSRRAQTSEGAAGTFDVEVPNKGFGLLLNQLLGGTVAPVQQGATAAWLQTHALADQTGKSVTIQKGLPDLGGTVRPYTIRGGKVTQMDFACALDELLICTTTVDGQVMSEVESLAVASYPNSGVPLAPFHWAQLGVRMGTFGAEVAVDGVKGIACSIARPSYTDRIYANQAGRKKEQLSNDWPTVTGTIQTDYVDKTVFADRMAADSSTSMVLEWIGPLIASTFFQTFRIRLPLIVFNDSTPNVEGPAQVSPAFSFEAQLDGTNPLVTVEYMSTDTAL